MSQVDGIYIVTSKDPFKFSAPSVTMYFSKFVFQILLEKWIFDIVFK